MCQKQKDLTQDYIATGHTLAQTSLLPRDRMEVMGKELIQLCDQVEQHGLVDYQMGIWEEEILCGKSNPFPFAVNGYLEVFQIAEKDIHILT